ncbi:hypothetical protein ACJ5NV_13465 [Loktanella agnita]|uniref:hypothetical protein n=1 Tax=Loktanella agnita TaxID=287097 RepID=UPI0039873CEE
MLWWIIDGAILLSVEGWVRVTAYRQWRLLRRRQRRYGVRRVRIAAPRLADEKFLWRRLFDHDPRFTVLSDKIACKDWVREQGFAVKLPRTLWTGDDARDIPDAVWAQPIYIKAGHGWQMNIPVLSEPADRMPLIAQANEFMAQSHGLEGHQWGYANVPRQLLAEEALFLDTDLIEIKYYTFGSIVEQMVISRHGDPTTSARWLRQESGGYARDDRPTTVSPIIDVLPLPPAADEGLRIAAEIGAGFDQMRIDTMTDGEDIYVGEITVYNQGGRAHSQGHYAEAPLNRSWDLRRSWFLTHPQSGWRAIYSSALRRRIDARERQGHGLA